METEFNNSRCYRPQEWQTYCAGMLQESERIQMEEHLLQCNNCLSIYLDFLNKSLQRESFSQLGQEFTDKVMANIQKENYTQGHNNKINLIISYCAAACIVMFFWVGGYFDKISEGLSEGTKLSKPLETIEARIEPPKSFIQTGWTQKVLKKEKSFFEKSFLEDLIKKE